MREHAGDEHDYHASNYGHGSAATARTNDYYNNTHERRLLIAVTGRGCVCRRRGSVGRRLRSLEKQH